MASKSSSSAVLFLALNLLFFIFVTANNKPSPCYKPTPKPGLTNTLNSDSSGSTCPRDALKLGLCANLLGLGNVVVGSPPTLPCCSLLEGLVDLEEAVGLCISIRANVLGHKSQRTRLTKLAAERMWKKGPNWFPMRLDITSPTVVHDLYVYVK